MLKDHVYPVECCNQSAYSGEVFRLVVGRVEKPVNLLLPLVGAHEIRSLKGFAPKLAEDRGG
jgi:hypothetical protein